MGQLLNTRTVHTEESKNKNKKMFVCFRFLSIETACTDSTLPLLDKVSQLFLFLV